MNQIIQAVSEIKIIAHKVPYFKLMVCDTKIHEEVGIVEIEKWIKKERHWVLEGQARFLSLNLLEKKTSTRLFCWFHGPFLRVSKTAKFSRSLGHPTQSWKLPMEEIN